VPEGLLIRKVKIVTKLVNPVSLGTLYFSFALSLWSSGQISGSVFGIAILTSIISFAFFVAVFSKSVLNKLSKWVVKPLVGLTFLAFVYGFIIGWLQTFPQVSGVVLEVVAFFGFAWIIAILLVMFRDATQPTNNNNRLFILFRTYFPYLIILALLIIAVIKFVSRDFWGGGYLIVIAGLSLSVVRGWLPVNGDVYE